MLRKLKGNQVWRKTRRKQHSGCGIIKVPKTKNNSQLLCNTNCEWKNTNDIKWKKPLLGDRKG